MSIKDLSGVKKNTSVNLRKGGIAYFRGIEGEGRGAKVKVAASPAAKKTELVAPQLISSLT